MTDLVPREQRGAAVHLVLNRPDKLNSLNVPLFQALDAHVRDIAAGAAVVVLRGAASSCEASFGWKRTRRTMAQLACPPGSTETVEK